MNAFLIKQILCELQNNPYLLAEINISTSAIRAQDCIIAMLNSLPPDSVVLQFIYHNLGQPVEVLGTLLDGGLDSLRTPKDLTFGYNLRNVPSNGGVYILSAVANILQYVGSTANHYHRLNGHISQFKGSRGPLLDLTNMYDWASVNGGLAGWEWYQVYGTFNYYLNFVQTYPFYPLSEGEFAILAAMSQLLPRILEQSLLNAFSFQWNKAMNVSFKYVSWTESSLEHYAFKNYKGTPVEIRDFSTEELIRPVLPSISMAGDVLGIKSSLWMNKCVNQRRAIDLKAFGRKVRVIRVRPS